MNELSFACAFSTIFCAIVTFFGVIKFGAVIFPSKIYTKDFVLCVLDLPSLRDLLGVHCGVNSLTT